MHDKVLAGMVLVLLLLAYDIASRIDEHVTCLPPRATVPSATDDAIAMSRF
jgi:hypothetical protein